MRQRIPAVGAAFRCCLADVALQKLPNRRIISQYCGGVNVRGCDFGIFRENAASPVDSAGAVPAPVHRSAGGSDEPVGQFAHASSYHSCTARQAAVNVSPTMSQAPPLSLLSLL